MRDAKLCHLEGWMCQPKSRLVSYLIFHIRNSIDLMLALPTTIWRKLWFAVPFLTIKYNGYNRGKQSAECFWNIHWFRKGVDGLTAHKVYEAHIQSEYDRCVRHQKYCLASTEELMELSGNHYNYKTACLKCSKLFKHESIKISRVSSYCLTWRLQSAGSTNINQL